MQAINLGLNEATAYNDCAIGYFRLGRYEEAIEVLEQAIKLRPDYAEAYSNLGMAHFMLKHYSEAIESQKKACELTKYKEHTYIAALAVAYAEQKDFDKAIEYQKKAVDLVGEKEFTGIGISFDKTDGQIKIVSVIQDTPAFMSGLVVGDLIEAVNGQKTKDMSIENVANIISGPVGIKVTLTVKRLGKDTSEDITLNRAKIVNPIITEYEKRLEAYKTRKPWRE